MRWNSDRRARRHGSDSKNTRALMQGMAFAFALLMGWGGLAAPAWAKTATVTRNPLPGGDSKTQVSASRGESAKHDEDGEQRTPYRIHAGLSAPAAATPASVLAGSGGPILVITTAANPFSSYYAEILRAEGLNAFTAMDLASVDATVLADYDVVILGETVLSPARVAMLASWTNAGGLLVAMRPDAQLAGLLGLTPAGGTLSNAYLLVNTASGPGVGIVGQTMQYHGTADRYSLNGAASIATLYQNANLATTNPAVTLRNVGTNGGKAVAFTYDLARSIVYTRQGNPAWAGQKRDGQPEPIRSDDLFFGDAAGDPQPDWIDLNKVAIPQADEQQRLLANVIEKGNLHRKPLPRFWYLPKGLKAAVVMTGDDHGDTGMQPRFDIYRNQSPAECSVDDWECVRATGYEYVSTAFTDAQAQFYNSLGFEVALHITTNCSRATPAEYTAYASSQLADFATTFPNVPPPSTNRNHCIAWSDWSSVAEIESAYGIRFDTNYYYWPAAWVQSRPGMFTGSGFPMRFTKIDGTVIDCYQAATQMTDESGQSFPQTCDDLLDRATGPEGYYGVFTANMHFDFHQQYASDVIVASAQAHGVPVVSAKQMLTWIDGRNGSSFGNIAWNANALSFSVAMAAGSRNLRGMVPTVSAIGTLSSLTRNGGAVAYTTEAIKGIEYAFFPASAGDYVATYTPDTTPPVISAINATLNLDGSATVTWTTNEVSDSRVDFGTGSLNLAVMDAAIVTSHAVTLTGLSPNTVYYYRVTSTDASGNSATAPFQPLSFTTPPPACFVDDLANDFAAGTTGAGTAVTVTANGEIALAPAAAAEFTVLPPAVEWAAFPWQVGGTAAVSGGQIDLDGSRLNSEPEATTYGPGTSMECVTTFGASAFQTIGFGAGGDVAPNEVFNTTPFATFSTGNTGSGVITRVFNSGTNTVLDFPVPLSLIGAPHRYRIDWNATSVDFSVDGALVRSEVVTITDPMRPALSDYIFGGADLQVDWVRVLPYAASGTFVSRVFDAGSSTQWNSMLWAAQTPAGTSVSLAYRLGSTAVPDGGWSAFTPVAASGGPVGLSARYIQYQAVLGTTDTRVTPVLEDVNITCCTSSTPPPPITNLAVERTTVDSNADGTRQIRLTFSTPGNVASVEVYRAKFGNYPYYDNAPNAGSVPTTPTYPPSPRWTLTGITAGGQTDEVAQRDEYYFVAFAKNACGIASAASNLVGGVLNYALGDVHDGQPGHECSGNNIVFMEDVSYLGSNYGANLASGDSRGCLDVGPTSTGTTFGRPLTDATIDFEDLMIYALNFSPTPTTFESMQSASPRNNQARQQSIVQDQLWLESPPAVAVGEEFTVRLRMVGSGSVHGVSTQLAWDAAVAEPVAVAAGELAQTQNAVVFSARPGGVDVARLGGGINGSGVLAEVRFRAVAAGHPAVRMAATTGRNALNQNVTFAQPLAVPGTIVPARTGLGFAAPNPFRTRLGVQLAISHSQRARLQVYDLAGRVVNTLVDGEQSPGTRTVIWDGLDRQGRMAAAGVYIIKLETADLQQTRRVQLLR